MTTIDTSKWTLLGETSNTRYFEVSGDVLAAVPNPGSSDDLVTARENVAFQNAHWKNKGHPGGVLVFFDNMVSQNKDARGVYQTELDATMTRATCLVGGTLLTRAMGSFFLGISKPRVKLRMFRDAESAIAWLGELAETAKKEERT